MGLASCRRGVEARATRMMGWCRMAEAATTTGGGGYGRYPFSFCFSSNVLWQLDSAATLIIGTCSLCRMAAAAMTVTGCC
ncbi:unnamed protein product [Prunus armeniaca]